MGVGFERWALWGGGGGCKKLHRDNKVNKKRSVHVKLHFKVQENRVETGYTYTYLYNIIYIFIMNLY